MSGRRFVILDRDGTVIHDRHYLRDPEQVELIPGSAAAIRQLRGLGLGVVIATNQSGVARGYFDESCLGAIHERMKCLLAAEDASIDAIYWCPHAPSDDCACRKPRAGLVAAAAREQGFSAADAIVVGDNLCDIELAERLGATGILVRTGHGKEVEATGRAGAAIVADDLRAAADLITRMLGARAEGGGLHAPGR